TDSARQGKPCRSSHESPFHSDLQPSCSRASSWEHLTLAHLPVHPPTPPTRTQQSYPRNAERELKNLTTPFLTLPTSATVEKTYSSTENLQPLHPGNPDPSSTSSLGSDSFQPVFSK
ncbi:hypothetical protein CRENBAI_023512, partial [Crenichthys baileyi]